MLYWPSALPFLSCPLTLIGQQDEEHTSLPAAPPPNAKTQCVRAHVCHYQSCPGRFLRKPLVIRPRCGSQKHDQMKQDERLFSHVSEQRGQRSAISCTHTAVRSSPEKQPPFPVTFYVKAEVRKVSRRSRQTSRLSPPHDVSASLMQPGCMRLCTSLT